MCDGDKEVDPDVGHRGDDGSRNIGWATRLAHVASDRGPATNVLVSWLLARCVECRVRFRTTFVAAGGLRRHFCFIRRGPFCRTWRERVMANGETGGGDIDGDEER